MLIFTNLDTNVFNLFVVIDDRYISYDERKSQGLQQTLTKNECISDLRHLYILLDKYPIGIERKIIQNRIDKIKTVLNYEFKISA